MQPLSRHTEADLICFANGRPEFSSQNYLAQTVHCTFVPGTASPWVVSRSA